MKRVTELRQRQAVRRAAELPGLRGDRVLVERLVRELAALRAVTRPEMVEGNAFHLHAEESERVHV
jgi:hypothetical protein